MIRRLFCFLGMHVYCCDHVFTFGPSNFIPECRCVYCNYNPAAVRN